MIIYLHGPDSYRRQEKLNWYLDEFRKKHSALTVERFDLEIPDEMARFKDFAAAQSLFADFKFGILGGVAEIHPKELEGSFKLATDSKALTLAISVDEKLPKEFKPLYGKGVIKEEFKEIPPGALADFIAEQAAARRLKISASDIKVLSQNYSGNAWAIITELDKLVLGGSTEPLRQQENFFALLNRISRGDLAALTRLLESEDSAKIFNMLASFAKASEAKAKIADYDVAIKSGKLDYAEALISLALDA